MSPGGTSEDSRIARPELVLVALLLSGAVVTDLILSGTVVGHLGYLVPATLLVVLSARRERRGSAAAGVELVGRCSEIADGMIVLLRPDQTIEHANTAACELIGRDLESLRGRGFLDELVPEPNRAESREALRKAVAGEARSVRLESRIVTREGEERVVRWRWTGIGETHVVGWGTDVTERRRARAEFLQRAALARLGEMTAMVAHEVRNPLAGIRGAVELLGERLPESDEGRSVAREVLTRLEGLERLVDEMLLFARPSRPTCEPLGIRPLIEEVWRLVERDPSFGSLRIDLVGPAANLVADPVLLRQLFLNVLLNAAQASPAGGLVKVAVEVDRECHVTVSDEGPGVPVELRSKIFEPFFTTKHHGSGLGLPIAWRAANLHGGEITARFPPSGGTAIEIRLPLDPVPSPGAG
ncbi:MAG: PAS domain-containing protein [Deltaproteobacteria bacterium]|nr:PAS domain-containing protein [Deltaproteobacteria bacterium]